MVTQLLQYLKLKNSILFLSLLSLFSFSLSAGELGAFYLKQNAYAFEQPESKGVRVLLKKSQIYPVFDIFTDRQNRVYLKIRQKFKNNRDNTGYVFSKRQVNDSIKKMIKVFSAIPQDITSEDNFYLISLENIQYDETSKPTLIENLHWYQVRYQNNMRYKWVNQNAGIFRVDQTRSDLEDKADKINELKIDQNNFNLILAGKAEVGFTERMTELALGKPLAIKNIPEDGTVLWEYPAQEVIFQFKKVITITKK